MRPQLQFWHIAVLALFSGACTAGAGMSLGGAAIVNVVAAIALFAACGPKDKDKDGFDVGPCLSPPLEDMGQLDFGPCLSPNLAPGDMQIGPCLSPPLPDMGPSDMQQPLDIGPCLSQPPPDFGTVPDASSDMSDMGEVGALRERDEILDRLGTRLPADIAARLKGDDDREA